MTSVRSAECGVRSEKPKADLSDLLGKTFRYGGRGPLEYDCYGLCMEIYRRRGLEIPEFGSAILPSVINKMVASGREAFVAIEKPEPFCLVLFRIHPRYVSHIGVVLEDGVRFIHIMAKSRVTIERLDGIIWKNKIAGYLKYETA